jgi:hypothetical protein
VLLKVCCFILLLTRHHAFPRPKSTLFRGCSDCSAHVQSYSGVCAGELWEVSLPVSICFSFTVTSCFDYSLLPNDWITLTPCPHSTFAKVNAWLPSCLHTCHAKANAADGCALEDYTCHCVNYQVYSDVSQCYISQLNESLLTPLQPRQSNPAPSHPHSAATKPALSRTLRKRAQS